MSGRIGSRVVRNGLVLHLDAANTGSYINGSTTWNDLSNNRGIMSATTASTYTNSNVGGVIFTASTYFFKSNLVIQPPNDLSISCWFKATGPSVNNDTFGGCLIISCPQSIIGYTIGYSWTDQKVSFGTLINDFVISPIGSALQNGIYNVTGVQSSTQQLLYINGELAASRTYSTPNSYPTSGDTSVRIGNWGNGGLVRNFNGNIYQTLIYNKALTVNEVRQNYQALKGRFGL